MSHTGPTSQISEHQAERWQAVCSKTHGKSMWQQTSKPRYDWIKIPCLSSIPTALVEEAWLKTTKYKISTPSRINNIYIYIYIYIHTHTYAHTYRDPHTLQLQRTNKWGGGELGFKLTKKMKKCKLHELFFIYKDLKAGKGINYHSNILRIK